MAFSISYIYQIIDKYSVPQAKINRSIRYFEKAIAKAQSRVKLAESTFESFKDTTSNLGASFLSFRGNIEASRVGLASMAKQTRVLQTQIKGLKTGLQGMNSTISDTEKTAKKASRKVSELTKKMNLLSRTRHGLKQMNHRLMNLQSGIASVVGVMSAATTGRTFTDFEETMNVARGTTQATAHEFELLKEKAKTLGQTTQSTAAQAASGIEMLGRNGLRATQILDGAIDASLLLSHATGTDLANSANIATDVMAAFGKRASELPGIVNQIAGVTINSKFDIDDYRLALGQAGGVAGEVGVTLRDFNTAIAAIAPLFASGSDAGTSFKTFLQSMNPRSKEAARIMKALNISFFDSAGQMKSMADISQTLNRVFSGLTEKQKAFVAEVIFGRDATRAAFGIAKLGAQEFNKLAVAVDKVSAQKLAEDRMKGLSGVLKKLKSAGEGVVIALFESGFADMLVDIGNKFTEVLRRVSKVSPGILKFAAIIGGLIVVIGPVIMAFGLLAGAISVLLSPIGAIVAGIGVLVSAGVALYSTNENIRDAFHAVSRAVKRFGGIFKPLIDLWKKFFSATGGAEAWIDGIAAVIKALAVAIESVLYPLERMIHLLSKLSFDKIKQVTRKIVGLEDIPVGRAIIPEVVPPIFRDSLMKFPEDRVSVQKNAAVQNTISGMIQISTTGNARVDSASMNTDLPGNLGFNVNDRN